MVNLLILLTIVIVDPFKWINYERINSYEIHKVKYSIKVYVGNKCIEGDGCYSNDSDTSIPEVIYIPMPMQGSFSFDDLFNQ